jgi:L-asparaginase
MNQPVAVYLTGGTIDKVYTQSTGLMEHTKSSIILSVLQKVNYSVTCRVIPLFMKDSIDILSKERSFIKQSCENDPYDKIVVVHGTDTIIDTATLLSEIPDKTIICVGAFIPHSIQNSDAEFNLGVAMAYAQTLPPGSYVAMNGIAFPHDQVVKNHNNQVFEYK